MDQNLFSCVTTLLRPGRRPKLVRMFRKSPGTTKAESHWTQKALTKKEAPVQKNGTFKLDLNLPLPTQDAEWLLKKRFMIRRDTD